MLCMMGTTRQRDAATTAQSLPSTCRATACACSAPTACARSVLVLSIALSSRPPGGLLVLACMCMSTCIHTSIYPHVIHRLQHAATQCALLVLACMCMSTCIHTSIYPHVIHTLQHAATQCARVHVSCTCAYMHLCMCMYVERRHVRGGVAHEVLSCETFLLQSLVTCCSVMHCVAVCGSPSVRCCMLRCGPRHARLL